MHVHVHGIYMYVHVSMLVNQQSGVAANMWLISHVTDGKQKTHNRYRYAVQMYMYTVAWQQMHDNYSKHIALSIDIATTFPKL